MSQRAARPFLALNCAAISPNLVEPTLFGYAKGSFTGATTARSGYFEDATDSTLFLDEIGELPLELQAKLLRVLENGEYQRVGETQSRVSNARVVAATNRDMRQEIRARALPRRPLPPPVRIHHQRAAAARPRRGQARAARPLPRVLRAPGAREPVRARCRRAASLARLRLSRQRAGAAQHRDPPHHEICRPEGRHGRAAAGARHGEPRHRAAGPGGGAGLQGGAGCRQAPPAAAQELQPRQHARPVGARLYRGGAVDHAGQPDAGRQDARHPPHHPLQQDAELRRTGGSGDRRRDRPPRARNVQRPRARGARGRGKRRCITAISD